MADDLRRTPHLRDWVQTLLLGAGIGAGVWQFVFKEIWAPAAAPINVTTEVAVKRAGFRNTSEQTAGAQLEAIEVAVTAKNPSARDVWLLPTCWSANGVTVVAAPQDGDWTNRVTTQINDRRRTAEGLSYRWGNLITVAAGDVFPDDGVIHPNESITTSFVFYVPQRVYDVLYIRVQLPTTPIANSADIVWTVTPEGGCEARAYRTKKAGERGEEITDFLAAFRDPTLQFQTAVSTRELSLWQSNPPPAAGEPSAGPSPSR
ncbi:MAG: hypothetical protein QOG38_1171 [Hyphomicrobiales bacterium]|nr:hypothetical protein [Hyphomicrobiales bacterium]